MDADGESIVSAIESLLAQEVSGAGNGAASTIDGIPLLHRGDAIIAPLTWESTDSTATPFEQQEISRRANVLWEQVGGACRYRHGDQIGIELSTAQGSYARELVRTGARRADWWAFGDRAVVLVVYGPPVPEPKTLIGVHIVPRAWTWDDLAHAEATSTDLGVGDLSWSWTDAVAAACGR